MSLLRSASTGSDRTGRIRIGFVALIDAAPLIVASEKGYFKENGLDVVLQRQIGWGNVRDKLAHGQLDASHAVLGMPLAAELAGERRGEPLIGVMGLCSAGNAITLSRRLRDSGVTSAASLARWARDRRSEGPIPLAHVFASSMHHYLLRDWLAAGGVNPDRDVRLCVIPPPMMAGHLRYGHLEGFCVGEPWNTFAWTEGDGFIAAATADLLPAHPEKLLVVSRAFAERDPSVVTAMVQATLRGCAFCNDPANFDSLAEILAMPQYIGVRLDVLRASIAVDASFGIDPRYRHVRPPDWQIRSFAPSRMFPSANHVAWLASQMARWGHLSSDADLKALAASCTVSSYFREAAASLAIECPPDDFPPMPLRNGGWFDVNRPAESVSGIGVTEYVRTNG